MNCIVRIIVVATACVVALSSPLRAQDDQAGVKGDASFRPTASLGFNFLYTWWRPMLPLVSQADLALGIAMVLQGNPAGILLATDMKDRRVTLSGPIYGPTLMVKVAPRWTISGNFLYGSFDYEYGFLKIVGIHKLEADLIASYQILDWLRFYWGGKYFGMIHSLVENQKGGMGLGFAFNIHLYRGLYLLPNVSALGLADKDWLTAGVNGTLSLAYYFEKIRLTVALGGRCQYLKDVYQHRNERALMLVNRGRGDRDDLFYGPTLSLVYTF